MTNISPTQEANHVDTITTPTDIPDPIDQLIPPPRPWWVRLAVGLGVVLAVGCVSFLVGFGYVYPKPECCGSGSGDSPMSLAPDGESVIVGAYFFNSSGRSLDILSADVDLPGADVLEVGFGGPESFFEGDEPLPTTIGGTESGRFVIRFVPRDCSTDREQWGSVELRLDVVNRWLPSIDRTFRLPEPVFDSARGPLNILPPDDDQRWYQFDDPLAAACALIASARP
jgi:hypothetical protein